MRAPEYKDFVEADVSLAREYLADKIKPVIGSSLKIDGRLLVNDKTGAKYSTVVCQVHQDGCIHIPMDATTGQVLHNDAGDTWIAALIPSTSEILLIAKSQLIIACQRQDLQSVVSPAMHPDGFTVVRVNLGWAKNSLIKKSGIGGTGGESFMSLRKRKRASSEQFCHLHVHSMYSFLDGVSTPEGIVQRAVENGQPGIALTDHGYMFGTFKFYEAARDAGIRPVMGLEFYVVDDVTARYKDGQGNLRRFEYHLTVLASNQQGWENLCTLASLACRDHFYHVPRIDWNLLERHNEGLIVLSGCFKGAVAWHLQEFGTKLNADDEVLGPDGKPVYARDPDRSRSRLRWLKRVFGDRLYAELQCIDYDRYMCAMPQIAQLAADEGVPAVVTNDAHYETQEDAVLQQVLTRISSNAVGDSDAFAKRGVYFIKTIDEMAHPVLSPDMFHRTCEVMERCKVDIPLQGDPDFKFLFPPYAVQQDEDWGAFQLSRAS